MRRIVFNIFSLTSIAFLFLPFFVHSILITEIMYDPKDTDVNSGGEWIEVFNNSETSVDLSTWFFFENDTNHSISTDGEKDLPKGAYAIISKDLNVFKNFFNNYSGLLFKASFSLNDGEKLAMKSDKLGPEIDSVNYSSEWGGKNDGNSLQRVGTENEWKAGVPTPGVENISNNQGEQNIVTTTTTTNTISNPSATYSGGGESEESVYLTMKIDGPNNIIAGARAMFSGTAFNKEDKKIDGVRFLWNFGDGETKDGVRVEHIYYSPGEYVLYLNGEAGGVTGIDRKVINVFPAEVYLKEIKTGEDGFASILNNLSVEIDISNYFLASDERIFKIPENTIILPKRTLNISAKIAGFSFANDTKLFLANGVSAPLFVQNIVAQASSKNEKVEVKVLEKPKEISEISGNEIILNNKDILKSDRPRDQKEENLENLASSGVGTKGVSKWVLLFIVLVVAGILIVFYLYREENSKENSSEDDDEIKLEAKKFEIVE